MSIYTDTTTKRLEAAAEAAQLPATDARSELFPDLITSTSVPKWRSDEVGLTTMTRETPCGTCGGHVFVLHKNNTSTGKHRIKCHNCKLEEPKRNLEAKQARDARRRAHERNAVPDDLSEQDNQAIRALYEERNRLTKETGVEHHVDHIIPISRGGAHHPSNMRVIPAIDNIRKGNKLPHELANNSKESATAHTFPWNMTT